MGKSYNNFITLEQFFSGNHPLLSKPFGPMVIRFFILQAHYRSTVDFSSEALEAAEKGLQRLQEAYARLQKLQTGSATSVEVTGLRQRCVDAMDDEVFGLWLDYHFSICERQDLVGASNHTLDILRKK